MNEDGDRYGRDLLTLAGILENAPEGGLSIPEIQDKTRALGDTWSYRTINTCLCGLGNLITHEKVRTKRGKVTKYQPRTDSRGAKEPIP